jgi:hypothetical protein
MNKKLLAVAVAGTLSLVVNASVAGRRSRSAKAW